MKPWQIQERRVAKRRGGKQNPGSGSGWRKPNDVREDKILWEMKQTDGKSISIDSATWEHLRTNALTTDRMPAMHLEIGGGRRPLRLCVISEDDFDEFFPLA